MLPYLGKLLAEFSGSARACVRGGASTNRSYFLSLSAGIDTINRDIGSRRGVVTVDAVVDVAILLNVYELGNAQFVSPLSEAVGLRGLRGPP